MVTGFETENKYVVRNTLGQQVYFAAEGKFPYCSKKKMMGEHDIDHNYIRSEHKLIVILWQRSRLVWLVGILISTYFHSAPYTGLAGGILMGGFEAESRIDLFLQLLD